MAYYPRARASKKIKRQYKKAQEKNKPVRQSNSQETRRSQQQIFETTLKRLHTLGNQKFATSPFSEHFNYWLRTVETILNEFETQPNIDADEQFIKERTQTLTTIKLQLEKHREKENTFEKQIIKLSTAKNRIQQVKKDYLISISTLTKQRTDALKQLNNELEDLKREQDQIIKTKTGFFRGISRKEREQKEAIIVQKYLDKQQELEITTLSFKEKQKQLKEEFENKQEPLIEDIKKFQNYVKETDEDSSLEDRWHACESLMDIINNFFQRKISNTV
ncbi:MAG: hypothetical protein LBE76_02895 [Nitrososphaerota archaeon]|jgi:hypothetical protein|nr:hypothetical protein [Nitrososphaerota archaeon]